MDRFMIKRLPRIFFGSGRIVELAALVAGLGDSALLVTGRASFVRTEHWPRLRQDLKDRGVACAVEHIAGEPSPQAVDDIAVRWRNRGINVVVGLGGGAALDGGKAVSAMLPVEGGVADYLEDVGCRKPDGRKIPFVAVPTTAGTGSEVTGNAVIAQPGTRGFKKSLRHDNYVPDLALIDPALTLACPPATTVNCAMDAFTQLVESYLSSAASPYTDDLALGALARMAQSLPSILSGRGDIADRENMAYAAFVSGLTLSNAGLGVIHGCAAVIGGRYAIPHGAVCGTLMAAGNAVTLRRLRQSGGGEAALAKYATLGRLFGGGNGDDRRLQDCFISVLEQLTADLPLPLLGEYGMDDASTSDIARRCSSKNNPIKLAPEDIEEILRLRLR